MRDIHSLCRICLSKGSRDIFESSLASNLSARDDLSRFAEKLRFVTMLKINPRENLPQQICDLCIVQLNVSYNFKRLALKNDFQIREYMIENGVSLSKEDDDSMETTEIHQIRHNVIRTNRYRQIITAPEIRRNSTISSVSATSAMIINGRESDAVPSTTNNFVSPQPIIRPMQIKEEPVDPDEEERKDESPVTSSPSNASEPASILTVSSTSPNEKQTTPMVVINGLINNESYAKKSTAPESFSPPTTKAAPLCVKIGGLGKSVLSTVEMKKKLYNLRTIKKKGSEKNKKKLKSIIKQIVQRESPTKRNADKKQNDLGKFRLQSKSDAKVEQKRRGRPKKVPGAPKMAYKKRNNDKTRS